MHYTSNVHFFREYLIKINVQTSAIESKLMKFTNFTFHFIGGLIMLSQKHKGAKKVKYRSGFFITTNKRPKFGKRQTEQNDESSSSSDSDSDNENDPRPARDKDHDAVYKRLRCFHTKPLPRQDSSVSGRLF